MLCFEIVMVTDNKCTGIDKMIFPMNSVANNILKNCVQEVNELEVMRLTLSKIF
jgi:hypothetical protein